jgi:hypothetical protein
MWLHRISTVCAVCFGRRWHGQCLSSRKMKQKVGRSHVHESAKFNNLVLVRTRKEKKGIGSFHPSTTSSLETSELLSCRACMTAHLQTLTHGGLDEALQSYEWLPYHSRSSIQCVSVLYISLIHLCSPNAPFFEKKRKLLILATKFSRMKQRLRNDDD